MDLGPHYTHVISLYAARQNTRKLYSHTIYLGYATPVYCEDYTSHACLSSSIVNPGIQINKCLQIFKSFNIEEGSTGGGGGGGGGVRGFPWEIP